MKILIVHNRYRSTAPSGENRVVDQESDALRSVGHDVEHFEKQSDDIAAWSPLRKATLPAKVVSNPSARRELATAIRRFAPDVVHVHNTFPILSPSVLYACRDERVPVVATLHNYKLVCASGDFFRDGSVCHDCAAGQVAPALRHGCYRGSTAATLPVVASMRTHRKAWQRLVSAYIFISASLQDLLSGMDFDPERMFVKPNFVPHDTAVGGQLTLAVRKRQVAYVGRLDHAKGVPLLMRAWDRYRATAGDDALRLVVAGGGPLEDDVRGWAADRASVEIAGHLSRADCAELIAQSRAVVLPSQWEETFGLVVAEAMASGVAPIAAGHGSFPELIADGVDGALFKPGAADDLANKIHDVDLYGGKYEEYGRRARMTYEERYDPRRNVDQLVDIYRFAMTRPVR